MIVVDTETTGTEPNKHSILSIGAIDFNYPDNRFYFECRAFDGAHVMKEALAINGFRKNQVFDKSKPSEKEAISAFLKWALVCEERTLAGHNVWFDRAFLKTAAERAHLNWTLADRMVDAHSLCFAHLLRRGIPPPSKNGHSALDSETVAAYVGIPAEVKPHNALNGAKQATEVIFRLLRDEPLFEEFRLYKVSWLI